MRQDEKLVTLFLQNYQSDIGERYEAKEFPEKIHRNKPAVEVIAFDQQGNSLAIEHTLTLPFTDERADAKSFSDVFEPLEQDASLRLPEYDVTLWIDVGAIPKGVNWKETSLKVKEWFSDKRHTIPEGVSIHKISNLGFDLSVKIEKTNLPGYEGKVFVGRTKMPKTFRAIIKKALSEKLPKLTATNADKRILLLEKNSPLVGYDEFTETIRLIGTEHPELAEVDEIWVANTVAMESEKVAWFLRVWPDCMEKKFKVKLA